MHKLELDYLLPPRTIENILQALATHKTRVVLSNADIFLVTCVLKVTKTSVLLDIARDSSTNLALCQPGTTLETKIGGVNHIFELPSVKMERDVLEAAFPVIAHQEQKRDVLRCTLTPSVPVTYLLEVNGLYQNVLVKDLSSRGVGLLISSTYYPKIKDASFIKSRISVPDLQNADVDFQIRHAAYLKPTVSASAGWRVGGVFPMIPPKVETALQRFVTRQTSKRTYL